MKKEFVFSLLFALLFTSFANAEKKEEFTPVSRPQQISTSIIAGVATAHNSAFLTDETLVPAVHFTQNQPTYLLNHFKGELGETLMDHLFTSGVLQQTGQWAKLTPTSIGRNGIDGLYVRVDSKGLPVKCLISDAKMNSARLGMTHDGKQMSHEWISPRVSRTAKSYRDLSQNLKGSQVSRVNGAKKILAEDRIYVPIRKNVHAEVWKTQNGYAFFSTDQSVTAADIERQASRMAHYLDGVASGKIAYRSRLFTYKSVGNQHVIQVYQVSSTGNIVKGSGEIFKGSFQELPKEIQRCIRRTAIQSLSRQKTMFGLQKYPTNSQAFKRAVRECCNNPEKFNELCVAPRTTPNLIRAGVTVATTAVLAGGLDAMVQYVSTGTVDWKRSGSIALLSGGSTAIGLGVSTALAQSGGILATSSAQILTSGSIAAVLTSYGMYAMGLCSLSEANQSAALGLTSAGLVAATPAVLMGIATCFGTTSTGVAISSLSGAAATNAAMAWLGGGTIAAGGGGMAAGALVVGGAVAAVVIAVPVIWETCKYFKTVKAQEVYMNALIDFTRGRVVNGIQHEWNR